jgi:hypothetical protein
MLAVAGASVLRPSARRLGDKGVRRGASQPAPRPSNARQPGEVRPGVQWPRCRPQPHHYATPSQIALVDQHLNPRCPWVFVASGSNAYELLQGA